MRLFALALLFTLCSVQAFSQPDTVYLNSDFKKLQEQQKAVYYRVATFSGPDRQKRVLTTYLLTGEKFFVESFEKNSEGNYKWEGPTQYWYKNGQLKEEKLYKGNETKVTKWYENGQLYYTYAELDRKKEGEAVGYYPGGEVLRRETFSKGDLLAGKRFSEDGKEVGYYPHSTPPEFPGGQKKLMEYFSRNFKMPVEAIKSGVNGVVVVKFQIDSTGQVGTLDILKPLHPGVDFAAIKVIRSLPVFSPATLEGVAVADFITVPINIKNTSSNTRTIKRRYNPAEGYQSPYGVGAGSGN